MRALALLTICFILGVSTTCGGGGPDIYGAYDLVSENAESLPTATTASGWLDWRADGCIPFQIWAIEAPDETASGTVCNGVITMANAGGVPLVFHKRL